MRIALCSEYYPRIGGIASHMSWLSSELQKFGHEVTIITRNCNGNGLPQNVIDVNFSMLPDNVIMPPNLSKLKKTLNEGKFDVIHGHHAFTPTSLFSISIGKKLGIPTVLTNHSTSFGYESEYFWIPFSYFLYPYRRYIKNADRIIAVSNAAADFIKHFANKERISVIPNPVDDAYFTNKKHNRTTKNKTILYVGRLSYRKGLHILIPAMKDVMKEFPEARLLIAGDGYMKRPLEAMVRVHGLKENVKMLGYVSPQKLLLLYRESDVFVLPSTYGESFGIVLLEAMASGIPVVATNIGGIKEIIKDKYSGMLVKKENKKDLANAITKVLSNSTLSKSLSQNARKEAEKYRLHEIAKKTESIYEDIISKR